MQFNDNETNQQTYADLLAVRYGTLPAALAAAKQPMTQQRSVSLNRHTAGSRNGQSEAVPCRAGGMLTCLVGRGERPYDRIFAVLIHERHGRQGQQNLRACGLQSFG